jgi:D-threo-aldose 1-dehydrogenase
LPAAALQFPLSVDGVTAVVVGMSSPAEVDENLTGLRTTIPAALWTELTAQSLLGPPEHT